MRFKLTDPKLFAIDRGARLRWIKNEEILVGVFSSSWKNYFVELPVNRKIDYIVGTDVTSTEAFNRNAVRANFTVSDDLYVRKVLTVKIDKNKLPYILKKEKNEGGELTFGLLPK